MTMVKLIRVLVPTTEPGAAWTRRGTARVSRDLLTDTVSSAS